MVLTLKLYAYKLIRAKYKRRPYVVFVCLRLYLHGTACSGGFLHKNSAIIFNYSLATAPPILVTFDNFPLRSGILRTRFGLSLTNHKV